MFGGVACLVCCHVHLCKCLAWFVCAYCCFVSKRLPMNEKRWVLRWLNCVCCAWAGCVWLVAHVSVDVL